MTFVMEGRMREKGKKGGIIEKVLKHEGRKEGRKERHKLSEREEENKERKEWREREIVDVEVRR